MLATPDYLQSHLRDDIESLEVEGKLREDSEDTLGSAFVQKSKIRIVTQIGTLEAFDTAKLRSDVEETQRILTRISLNECEAQNATSKLNNEMEASASNRPMGTAAGNVRPNKRNVNPSLDSSSYHFFMAANGRHVFLHPLDIRILLAKFTNYSRFPVNINIGIEAFVESSVDSDLRKRCKYLSHLPEGSDVVFIEASLETVVGGDVLRPFEQALKQRRSRRLEKERKEERAKIKAEEAAQKREREMGLSRDFEQLDFHIQMTDPRDTPEAETEVMDQQQSSPSASSGAWGSRSFAMAANAGAARARCGRDEPVQEEDVLSFEMAWHELEDRSRQPKGKGSRFVLLGGGGGRRRR